MQILDKNWQMPEVYTQHTSHRAGKAFFKVPPKHSSQEYADLSASKVTKWQAIKCFSNARRELSKSGAWLLAI